MQTERMIIIDGIGACKLCNLCDQPMKPKGIHKQPGEFDHACGCRYHKHTEVCPYAQDPRRETAG